MGDYLKEEIVAEAATRNIPSFIRFLEVAAISNGEIINFNNIASECGVSAPTVKGYFQILEDTLISKWIPAYRKQVKRRLMKGLRAFKEEHRSRCLLVSLDSRPRKTNDDILILPWKDFLEKS